MQIACSSPVWRKTAVWYFIFPSCHHYEHTDYSALHILIFFFLKPSLLFCMDATSEYKRMRRPSPTLGAVPLLTFWPVCIAHTHALHQHPTREYIFLT